MFDNMDSTNSRGGSGCQNCRRAALIRFILVLLAVSAGCSADPPKRNVTRTTQGDEYPVMEPRHLETTRTNHELKVDATIQEPEPLTGVIEIKTWANEVYRGRLVSETEDAYVLDVGPLDGSKPSIKRVPRASVMDLRRVHREP